MRVAIMGSGGVGGYYGGMLARAGEDVTFIARGAHLDAVRANGLMVKTTHVGEFTIPVKATDDPNEIGPVDLVLFCVKTYDTNTAAELIRPLIGSETVVLPLQNGVESPERIGRVVGEEHVIGGTTYVSSKIESPGIIKEIWDHRAYLGELNGQLGPRTEQLLKTFERAEVAVEIPPDIRVAMWSKLLGVSAFTAVCCVTRLPAAAIISCAETSALFWGAMEEGFAVARASGVTMPDNFLDQSRGIMAGINPMLRPSMYYDLQAGKPLELEDMIGVVVRLGNKHDVSTPLTFAMYAALKPYVSGAPDIPQR
ncbi:MAG: 2-dehydropantoate 2-reductase [Chroococcidiopsis sp. SAG 2025]|nr:2-dehydropantoate 2-reductase [Chroococcidiopsis sp. SAG 2025]